MHNNLRLFTDNIVFFDTEFSGHDFAKDEILSIGMVKMDGSELYLELDFNGPVNDWVKENVTPFLNKDKVTKEKSVVLITEFLGDSKPFLMSNITLFDMPFLYKLFEFKKSPFQDFPLDFSNILFSIGLSPTDFIGSENKINLCNQLGIDSSKYKLHNALDDAKLLREIYLKITS